MEWITKSTDDRIVKELESSVPSTERIAKLLALRGITDGSEAQCFIEPKLAHLDDPLEIPNLKEAAKRIISAIDSRESILLIGDYDVDGITSTVIVKKCLSALGVDPFHVIPRRNMEGYGLTDAILDRGLSMGKIDLVIALDCGTNSEKQMQDLATEGIDLIVVDHHQPKGEILDFPFLVNPQIHKENNEPWRYLCTAGLAFKLMHGIFKLLRNREPENKDSIDLKKLLPLVALGTIADMVPLKNENRIFARFGLKHMAKTSSPGIKTLLKKAQVEELEIRSLESELVTFKLAPRINACGRLDRPELATSLLIENNLEQCEKLSKIIDQCNQQRKKLESNLWKQSLEIAEKNFGKSSAAIIYGHGESWHSGIVGIVAGKLVNQLGKPCLVLAQNEDGIYQGSGRGPKGVNLVEVLSKCKEYLLHWGGHPAAIGLSVEKSKIASFTSAFLENMDFIYKDQIKEEKLMIDLTLSIDELNNELMEEIGILHPFGQENPEPLFRMHKVILSQKPKLVGSGEHFQFSISNGIHLIAGIAWRMSEKIPPINTEIDLAFNLRWNYWNESRKIQIVLLDWKFSN